MLNKCHAEVIAVLDLTHDVKEICLKLIDPPYLDFTAGQYITIEITEMKADIVTGVFAPHLKNRPYSIVSSPKEKSEIRLCTNRVGNGPGSSRLHSLKPSDLLEYFVPMSYFKVHEEDATALLFVATGTGIGPLKSMIHYLLQSGSTRPILLYWGLRMEEDLYYQEELKEWSQTYPHFRYVTTLSQASPAWQGMRGRVTGLVQCMEKVDHLSAYLCGNGEMIREVREMLLSKGMEKKSIHFEKFF
jgi:ferredoxin-NADP reductase